MDSRMFARAAAMLGWLAVLWLAVAPCSALARPGAPQMPLLQYATPGIGEEVACSGTSSKLVTGLAAGGLYRVGCTITVRFRFCATSTCTALVTDNPQGIGTEDYLLKDTETWWACITEAGSGKCVVAQRK